jgi:hypothetical protein
LIKAGLLGAHRDTGIWDADSANAYAVVLAQANVYGARDSDMLAFFIKNPVVDPTRQRAPMQMTNPLDIKASYSSQAESLTGGVLPEGGGNDFLKWYQDQEAQARVAYNDAGTDGGSYVGAPSTDAAAQEYIKEHNRPDMVAYGTASRMMDFYRLLGVL